MTYKEEEIRGLHTSNSNLYSSMTPHFGYPSVWIYSTISRTKTLTRYIPAFLIVRGAAVD